MINLYENFSLHHDFGLIDVYDIYDLFNDSLFYNLFSFESTQLEIIIQHYNLNNNKIIIYNNDDVHTLHVNNCITITMIETIAQFIRNQNMV